MFKAGQLLGRSFRALIRLVNYGATPTEEEVINQTKCAICYEEMTVPVKVREFFFGI